MVKEDIGKEKIKEIIKNLEWKKIKKIVVDDYNAFLGEKYISWEEETYEITSFQGDLDSHAGLQFILDDGTIINAWASEWGGFKIIKRKVRSNVL